MTYTNRIPEEAYAGARRHVGGGQNRGDQGEFSRLGGALICLLVTDLTEELAYGGPDS